MDDEDSLGLGKRVGEGTDIGTQGDCLKEGGAGPSDSSGKHTITDKEFYKAMQKLKDRGSGAVPPKKSASAYILFGKEVSKKPKQLKNLCLI